MRISSLLPITVFTTVFYSVTAFAAICTLNWNQNPETNLTGYHVYSSLVSHGYTQGGFMGTTGLMPGITCDQLGILADGLIHYFTVTAFGVEGESAFSNEVSIQLLNIPTCVHVTPHGKCTRWSNS